MSISELKAEIQRLEMELAETRAKLKGLFGEAYRKAELKIIRLKMDIRRAKSFLEIANYGAMSS